MVWDFVRGRAGVWRAEGVNGREVTDLTMQSLLAEMPGLRWTDSEKCATRRAGRARSSPGLTDPSSTVESRSTRASRADHRGRAAWWPVPVNASLPRTWPDPSSAVQCRATMATESTSLLGGLGGDGEKRASSEAGSSGWKDRRPSSHLEKVIRQGSSVKP